MAWAREHLPENPAISQLADMAHMSRRTFYRMFQAAAGTTPHRWLISQQVILACRLLETSLAATRAATSRPGLMASHRRPPGSGSPSEILA